MKQEKIGRYTLLRKLGLGSTATVYLGQAEGRQVAIKVLHKHLVLDKVIFERFRREATLARTLSHPGIVPIFDFIAWEEEAAMVMEYLPGGNLAGWQVEDWQTLQALALQVAGVLKYAHAKGLVHRDLKPENILKTPEGQFKICDFGSAHVQNLLGLTTSTMFSGSPLYTAPELLAGNLADPRSDLFSLGAILYQAATGKPHRGSSVISLFRPPSPVVAPSAMLPDFPDWLSAIILNLLGDLSERIPDAETLLYLLENHLPPEGRKVKSCLYCRQEMQAKVTLCLACGRSEWQYIKCTGAEAHFLLLKKISEDVAIMQRVLDVLKVLSGQRDLELKFITGDQRLYSRAEVKNGFLLPVRVVDNLSAIQARELEALLQGDVPIGEKLMFDICPMQKTRRYKRGPLIVPHPGPLPYQWGTRYLQRIAEGGRELADREIVVLYKRIGETGYAVSCRLAERENEVRNRETLGRLLTCLLTTCKQLDNQLEYLNSISLGSVYNEWQKIEGLLEQSEKTVEISRLIERKQELERIYLRFEQQEKQAAELKVAVLEVWGHLQILYRGLADPGNRGVNSCLILENMLAHLKTVLSTERELDI